MDMAPVKQQIAMLHKRSHKNKLQCDVCFDRVQEAEEGCLGLDGVQVAGKLFPGEPFLELVSKPHSLGDSLLMGLGDSSSRIPGESPGPFGQISLHVGAYLGVLLVGVG